MKTLSDMHTKFCDASEIGIFMFLCWFAGLAIGLVLGLGIGWITF